ncbi:hypothetical protein AUEXF2481DRAFT_41541 [Aureobasidium subglaciale EXF-2481]|uniref:Uncharacterized protein n=1 Tax=Aureobasidium subglaciale (strain EXF-2481) TaxID=1043005 RepID=A0A074YI90_AURSE|nr:uncharacterized protein AUEXF2481DRAFT_41541 [Aureobasidium subglaciale EXF-2481]KAI5208895.1 hypothetical protein E4T38_02644 [Aureobasidium subglaciale]KAI5227602.1 hypothetical protein E4T40_02531 [Aureobasidium subglaciale]KAI5231087.1 hypothetical protein E4T41_02643 [Aureobasidium subglaciale]KAI5265226.1 hypothetical protein E4T46_02421 [Aureobasidium subglaciale]KEQ93807.1 hypothetical protein AUEXF2481DRAFT_41541 [Aureobasidium subglaciale EXF-2481]
MHFTTTFAAVALLGTASALPGKFQFEKRTSTDCESAYNACRTKYDANMSTCASQYASCLGYNPFTGVAGPTASVITETAPIGTGSAVTKTEEVYTTTTVCPVTSTAWNGNSSTVITTSTTSTITVTSCAGGCHGGSATSKPTTQAEGSTTVKTHAIPTEVTSTITSFVPCSTPIMSNSETTFFSTWLTVSYLTTTYKTVTTSYETIHPKPTTVQVSTAVLPASTLTGHATGTCAAPETVYETVVSYVTVYGEHKTETAPAATNTPIQPGSTLTWSHTGSASGIAKPTGWVHPSGYAKPSGH